jgi:membrane protein insertase Oxa1/YidC/SpoIIIJ
VGTLPILIVQFIVLIGLYSGLRRVISNPHNLLSFTYPWIQHLSWMRYLAGNIHRFDNTLFGIVNLNRAALIPKGGGIYWPAMIIVLGSAVAQYYQAKQLMPTSADQRGLREILRDAGQGKQADQSEVNAAVGRNTRFLLPVMIFVFTVNLASALSLYWLTGGVVAYIQQSLVLRKDESEMETIADKPGKDVAKIPEAEVVEAKVESKTSSKPKNKKPKKKKRR